MHFGKTMVLIALAVLSSGCRFGNRVEYAPNPDVYTGYYEAEPKSVTFCAETTQSQCVEATSEHIPQAVAYTFTNPLAFLVDDLGKGEARFIGLAYKGYEFQVSFKTDYTLGFQGNSNPEPVWTDQFLNCTSFIAVKEEGKLLPSTEKKVVNNLKMSGRVALDFTFARDISGTNCADALYEMRQCYEDGTKCGGVDANDNLQRQGYVQALFGPYISAGAMTVSDIPNTKVLGYVISYR